MWVSEVAMQVSCGYDSIHVVKLQKMLRGCKYKCKSASSPLNMHRRSWCCSCFYKLRKNALRRIVASSNSMATSSKPNCT